MNIIGRRYLYFAISLLVIVPGIIALALWGLPLAIDYTGGSLLTVQFKGGTTPGTDQVVALYDSMNIQDSQVQRSGSDTLIIRSKEINDEEKNKIVAAMAAKFGGQPIVQEFDQVSPSVGAEVAAHAGEAVAAASVAILLYITFAFRGVPHAFRFGTAAIIAMLHDVLVVVGTAAIFGKAFGWEVDSLFLTALLTVIGFSVHDTIVVFDRIRENANIFRKLPFEGVVNHSIIQTLDRSINTQLTVMMTLAALVLFGGLTVRHFVLTLLIGVFSGTYSSIFNASPILVVWENREWRYWFKGNWKKPSTVSAP